MMIAADSPALPLAAVSEHCVCMPVAMTAAPHGHTSSPRLQILVGDPKQLEAMSEFYNVHIANKSGGLREQMLWHTRSAMQRLTMLWDKRGVSREHSCKLRTQYRMHEAVCQLVDSTFYSTTRPGQVLKRRQVHFTTRSVPR
jgi:hypothetical protein